MKQWSSFLWLGVFAVGCASSNSDNPATASDPTVPTPEETAAAAADTGPHALGVVQLTEFHAAGNAGASVSVAFAPNQELATKKAKACTRMIDGCEVTKVPKCSARCATGEACGFNDACESACIKIPSTCTEDECQTEVQEPYSFNAGAVMIRGSGSSAITMFPPYSFSGNLAETAPFLPGEELHILATGAKQAGFAAFDQKIVAIPYVESNPPLSQMKRTRLFGRKDVEIGWAPGADQIQLRFSGLLTAVCAGDDKAGTFSVTRNVLDAILYAAEDTEKANLPTGLSVSVTRTRTETRKGIATLGEIKNVKIEPKGWLELGTTSTESYTYSPCQKTQTECGSACTDLKSDGLNCGVCGTRCGNGAYCSAGKCTGGNGG